MRGALIAALVLLPGCATQVPQAEQPPTDFDLLVRACFEGAPTFAEAESLLVASGGQLEDRPGYGAYYSGLESVDEVGLWSGPATFGPERVWLIGVSEGEFRGRPASACYGVQSVYGSRAFADELVARWPTRLVAERPSMPIGFIERDYEVEINGSTLYVNLHFAAEHTYPVVRVIVAEEGAPQ